MRLVIVIVLVLLAAVLLMWPPQSEELPALPQTWTDLPFAHFPKHPWGCYLDGRTIGLDPGHGGIEGDDGQGFEGPVNLKVAEELASFLRREGATVILTRETDVSVRLKDRPRLCEEAGADVFISLHHNASAAGEAGRDVNYTSTYYHGSEDHEPASLDLARAIQRGVIEQLRTGRRVPMPVLSDHLVYKNQGFSVLRHARIPAVLCEASFYTNPEERQRLENDTYLRREAYGYYLGLVEYFTGGTPSARVVDRKKSKRSELRFRLDDGLESRGGWGSETQRILSSGIVCTVDGKAAPFRFVDKGRNAYLDVTLPSKGKSFAMRLHFENLYKHSNFPTRFRITRDGKKWIASE